MSIWLSICVAMLAAAPGLHESQERKKSDPDKVIITVTGCLDGSWLDVRKADGAGSYTTRYKLRGSKQLLKELASNYKRHLLEVTGVVTDSRSTTHRGKTVQVGKKTRIHTGVKDVPQVPSGDDPSLAVESFRELNNSCR
jgi:hypothetical protein